VVTAIQLHGRISARLPEAVTVRCVIVDDSIAVLRAASELLESEGIAVVGLASNGAEARRTVEAHSPDVVLLDIDLGAESGFGVARALEPVLHSTGSCSILISTHDESEFADLIAQSPAIGFVPKADLSAAAIHRLLATGSYGSDT
jgi:DNA-binding NarL/FixJ family response regulator